MNRIGELRTGDGQINEVPNETSVTAKIIQIATSSQGELVIFFYRKINGLRALQTTLINNL